MSAPQLVSLLMLAAMVALIVYTAYRVLFDPRHRKFKFLQREFDAAQARFHAAPPGSVASRCEAENMQIIVVEMGKIIHEGRAR